MKSQEGKEKVFVGLSGGVDSSVASAHLLERGFDVTGVFIKVWQPDWIECSATEDRLDAMRVCAHLDIPFTTLDLSKEYKRDVVDTMIREYEAGRTPNPDVMCNRYVKFGAFWEWAKAQGADYIATGHYSRKAEVPNPKHQIPNNNQIQNTKPTTYHLQTGRDSNKDQTYFLWTLTQDDLAHTLFPIGEYEKPHVRRMAERYGLPTAQKKDSQGLCFIGHVDMREFLSHFIDAQEGEVRNEAGECIGTHEGAVFYTLGQRHGFTVIKKSPNDMPYFVVAKDIEANTITVAHTPLTERAQKCVTLLRTNWIQGVPLENRMYEAQIRYRGERLACRVEASQVIFDAPVVVASGQSIVLYDSETCIGGGIVS